MPSLIGNKPNQVPSNGDLGTLAFQDASNPSVGNLNFTGTGNRITGDFSNATIANRVMFQTSTTNGNTNIHATPNGTGISSSFEASTAPIGSAASVAQLFSLTTDVRLAANVRDSGTFVPITMYTNGSERLRIDTSGNVGIGTSSPANRLSVNVSGAGEVTALNITNDNSGFAAGTGPTINFGISSLLTGAFGKIAVLNQTATIGSNSYMAFSTRGGDVLAERMRITSAGVVELAQGQIKFPATQVASADANTLDDYEEGTWTPSYTLSLGTASGVSSGGSYTKVGRQVTVSFFITFTTVSGASIDTITGLPFTVQNASQQSMGVAREGSVTGELWQLRANSNATTILIRKYQNSDVLSSGFSFTGSLTYFV